MQENFFKYFLCIIFIHYSTANVSFKEKKKRTSGEYIQKLWLSLTNLNIDMNKCALNFMSFWMWNGLNFWHVFIPIELLQYCLNLGFFFSKKKKKYKRKLLQWNIGFTTLSGAWKWNNFLLYAEKLIFCLNCFTFPL